MDFNNFLHIWKQEWMPSTSKLFYLFILHVTKMKIWRHCHVHDIDELWRRLLHVWQGLEQSLIDDSVDQWPTRLCSCQWRPFWTYLVTVNLFSLYFMKVMFHTTLDAVDNILRVHYKSMKCDVSFSQGSVSTLFRWGEHVFHVCAKMFFLLTAVQKL